MGMGGPIDLNFDSVFGYMDRMGIQIEDQEHVFDLVYLVYNHLERIRLQKEDKK